MACEHHTISASWGRLAARMAARTVDPRVGLWVDHLAGLLVVGHLDCQGLRHEVRHSVMLLLAHGA
jgi:hypothetical protein